MDSNHVQNSEIKTIREGFSADSAFILQPPQHFYGDELRVAGVLCWGSVTAPEEYEGQKWFSVGLGLPHDDPKMKAVVHELDRRNLGVYKPYKHDASGRVTLKIKSTFQPVIYDANCQICKLEAEPGFGSILMISAMIRPFTQGEGGISLYLQAIQMIEIRQPRDAASYGFTPAQVLAERDGDAQDFGKDEIPF